MKKKNEKKLSLGKIKIASLSKSNQQSVKGGIWNKTHSVCGDACCDTDVFTNCQSRQCW